MMSPENAIAELALLPHCISCSDYGEAPQKAQAAVLNLHSGLVVALPDTTASGWLGKKTVGPAPGLYIVCPNTRINGAAAPSGTDWCQLISGTEIAKLVATWTAQAKLLGL